MSKKTSDNKNAATETTLTRPAAQRTVVSKITARDTGRSLIPTANGQPWSSVSSMNSRAREEDTVQALMDLSLPRFTRLGDGVLPKTKLWTITEKPPSSPVSARDGNRMRTPSPCFQLDDISSASSIGDTSTNDYKMDTALSITPAGSIVFSSDEDVPLSSGQEDRRKVRRREPCRNDQPGPTEVPEYVPEPRERPVDIPIYKPTPRDRPVNGPTIGVRPVNDLMYDPMLREWPVDDRIFEPKTQLMPAGGQTMRERPGGEKPYGPRPRERPVDVPKLKGRPVDGLSNGPMQRERPVGTEAYELMPEERPVTDLKLIGRPVDEKVEEPPPGETPVGDETQEPIPENRPVTDPRLPIRPVGVVAFEPTPRDVPVDNQSITRRPADGEKSIPITDGRLAAGPNTIIRPKEGAVDQEAVPLLHKAPPPSEVPEWSDGEVMPLIIIEHKSGVEVPKTTDGRVPVGSDILLPQSLEMTNSEDQGVLSAPMSPNRVRKGHSQDMPAEGSIFDVSPDVPGYHMRTAGGGVLLADITQPPNYVGFNNPFFGAPIAFAQCQNTSGMDTTTALPVYNIPKDSSIGIDQSAVPTVYASGVSPDTIPWSTTEDIIRDIVREGPFDVHATPMETEDSPLINMSMPGCPYRMTSYTGTAMVDADTRYGLQLHHPRFLEFIGAPESARLLNQSPSFWVDRLGQESAMAAAVNLHRDAGFMMSNLKILGQFITSLHRMSAEMLSIGVDHVVFPVEEVDRLSVMPRAQRAAKYMTAMGMWRPPSGPGAPGPLPSSTCTSCMNCEYCFGRKGHSTR